LLARRRKNIDQHLPTTLDIKTMTFSIVIAAYNASSTIRAALQSCLSQTLSACEIIVVDDASTDNTAQTVKDFSPLVKLISLAKNKGVSAARNAGWEAATGDYMAFLDSDDSWHPEKLFWINACLQKNESPNLISHSFSNKSVDAEKTKPSSATTEISFSQLLLRNQIQGSCMIVKRTISQRFDEHMRYCEDSDLALRCAYDKPIIFLQSALSILSRPQQSEGGLSANKWAMRKGELYLFSKLGKLNPLLLLCIPILWMYSLAKHLFQKLQ
jgi:glycosyltransferase involved in cell wall biosynthesis